MPTEQIRLIRAVIRLIVSNLVIGARTSGLSRGGGCTELAPINGQFTHARDG
jgi:hypothetical protein